MPVPHNFFHRQLVNSSVNEGEDMEAKQAMQPQPKKEPENTIFVEAEKLFDQMRDFSTHVAKRAYEFFEARGREFGHEMEDWVRAEFELMRHVPIEVTQDDTHVFVRAEVPGFAFNDIKVNVEPKFVVISGRTEKKKEEEKGKTVWTEFRSNQFMRKLPLPVEVDPQKGTAILKDGILELTFARVPVNKGIAVEVKPA